MQMTGKKTRLSANTIRFIRAIRGLIQCVFREGCLNNPLGVSRVRDSQGLRAERDDAEGMNWMSGEIAVDAVHAQSIDDPR